MVKFDFVCFGSISDTSQTGQERPCSEVTESGRSMRFRDGLF